MDISKVINSFIYTIAWRQQLIFECLTNQHLYIAKQSAAFSLLRVRTLKSHITTLSRLQEIAIKKQMSNFAKILLLVICDFCVRTLMLLSVMNSKLTYPYLPYLFYSNFDRENEIQTRTCFKRKELKFRGNSTFRAFTKFQLLSYKIRK